MADEKILTNAQEDESSTLVKFSKAYRFEGKDYTEVDLSGMDDLSAEDMIAADRYLTRSGSFSVMPEMTLEYACFIAARAAKQPIEFFKGLPPKDALKVKNRVTSFSTARTERRAQRRPEKHLHQSFDVASFRPRPFSQNAVV